MTFPIITRWRLTRCLWLVSLILTLVTSKLLPSGTESKCISVLRAVNVSSTLAISIIGIVLLLRIRWHSKFDPSIRVNLAQDDRCEILHDASLALLLIQLLFIGFALFAVFSGSAQWRTANSKFHEANIEWFLVIGWCVTLVGALWAIQAKHRADSAFAASLRAAEKAMDAHKAALSAEEHAKNAFFAASTQSYDFEGLVTSRLDRLLKQARGSFLLLLGIPQIGFFYSDKLQSFPFAGREGANPEEGCAALLAKAILSHAQRVINADGHAEITFFGDELCKEIEAGVRSDKSNPMPSEMIAAFRSSLDSFLAGLEHLQQGPNGTRLSKSRYEPYNNKTKPFDPGIRIAIIDNSPPGHPDHAKEAMFWFVSDFVDKTPVDFEARCISTKDENLIALLERLAEYYLKLGLPASYALTKQSSAA